MAKIGILTSTPSFNDNYGAILQAYALQRWLILEGHEPSDILYHGDNEPMLNKKMSPVVRFKGIFFSGNTFRQALGTVLTKKVRQARSRYFQKFQNAHLVISNETYDFAALKKSVDDFDCCICGSDQVWNPRVHGGVNDPGYFLQFAVGERLTIAYAPSFGVSVLPDACYDNLAEFVAGIDYVSVREDSGAKLLADAGVKAPVVVDPTMLLTDKDYDKIAIRPDWLPERYIAVYKFGERNEFDSKIKDTANKLGLPIINIPASVDSSFKTRWDIGPSEFIAIIRDADLVCTDSFHATVFSTLYKTPCIVFPRDAIGSKKSMNSRMEGLLDRLGMSCRYVASSSEWDRALAMKIDYSEAHNRLAAWRSDSEKYLISALSGIGE
ncbi:polysaccharide pyruvyl transferase family protein [Collinsella sp. AF33-16]|uniref:polysaccharide pyruvyl transferase family protein n=1 Tax=Collinsella sp. AF33-16 TaxID=2292012 RepID=UPI000E55473A|nr:polysaccharide pyruvyl transferase family protein [Collinsella sp. AF33-16]RHM59729.1 hypothetical protein DWZ52_09195 [Collinsella sp. AF33-16]